MLRRVRTTTLVALAVLGALGCARRRAAETPAARPWDGEVTIQVFNHNWLDVVVYVVHSGRRDRLGVATGSATTEFRLRMRTLGAGREYRLLGDPVGSRGSVMTETLQARDGDVVTWTLETDLARSSVSVR